MKPPDLFAERGKPARFISILLLAPFAIILSVFTLLNIVQVIIDACVGRWDKLAGASAATVILGVVNVMLWWLVILIYGGTRSANRLTVIPSWFIQLFGVLWSLPAIFIIAGMIIWIESEWSWFFFTIAVCQLGIGFSLILTPWVARRRLRAHLAAFGLTDQEPAQSHVQTTTSHSEN